MFAMESVYDLLILKDMDIVVFVLQVIDDRLLESDITFTQW